MIEDEALMKASLGVWEGISQEEAKSLNPAQVELFWQDPEAPGAARIDGGLTGSSNPQAREDAWTFNSSKWKAKRSRRYGRLRSKPGISCGRTNITIGVCLRIYPDSA
ncbi:hypothetical protein GT019_09325 [Paenibacillus sp. T1]|uniref:Uncharacterized protein n=1 Tax=Paenibacillus glycinis TaxID=2697035 RepID=A0ABW9XN58_9BACL|nr:hypothetical protein [Paenibacillus glycinis]